MEDDTPQETDPDADPLGAPAAGSDPEVTPTEEDAALAEEAQKAANAAALAKLSEISGRTFKSWEDYDKHYKGVTKLAFAKKAPAMADDPTPKSNDLEKLSQEVAAMRIQNERNMFLKEEPKAEKFMDLVAKVAKSDNVSFKDAWTNSVKEIAEAKLFRDEALAKEQDPGITGSRLAPEDSKRIEDIATELRGVQTPGGNIFKPANANQLEVELIRKAIPDVLAELKRHVGE